MSRPKRTRAREIAVQALYQFDLARKAGRNAVSEELEGFIAEAAEDLEVREYSRRIVDAVRARVAELDERIAAASEHWKLSRISPVDRSILRAATAELLEMEDVPPKVVMDEAIELAKKFSTAQSGAFVNGILDRIYRDLGKESPLKGQVGSGDASVQEVREPKC